MPPLSSITPGPYARPFAMRNGRLVASPAWNTVSMCPISRILPWPLPVHVATTLVPLPGSAGFGVSTCAPSDLSWLTMVSATAFRCYGVAGTGWHDHRRKQPTERSMPQPNDLSRSPIALNQDGTLIAVIEMSRSSWLVAGIVPGIARHPLKKLAADAAALLGLLERWRSEATQAGRQITRIVVAFEAGRDGFWLARWLRARGIEAYVIHPTSVAVSREHRRAKTDRLDTALLKRVFLGWLRGEPDHCTMAAVPTLEEEDARRPNRERESLVGERTRVVNRMKATLARLGIRGFKPTVRGASERLEALRTPEGAALPPNTRAELRRDMARLCFIVG